jgi:CheY-like chemotaxis protein/CHASE3 domain sensor protein
MISKTSSKNRLVLIVCAILAILFFNAWVLNSNFQTVSEQEGLVVHTANVMSELDLILSSVKDAETGIRGFLLVKQDAYLEPYRNGTLEAWDHLNKVKSLTADNQSQQWAVASLENTIKKRFEILGDLLKKYSEKNQKVNGNAGQFYDGKSTMDSIREQIEKMKSVEIVLLAKRSQITGRSRSVFFWTLVGMTVLISLVITGAFIQIGRNQAKVEEESLGKSKQAKEKEIIANVTQLIAGDVSLENAGACILKFLSENFGILAGRLFVLDQNKLKVVASFGVKDVTTLKNNDTLDEKTSLVGAAFKRKDLWEIDDVPADYWHISSSLGETTPKSLTLLPFSFQNIPLGVFEFASFKKLSSEQSNLLSKINAVVGVSLHAAQSRGQLQTLLERTQQQSEELQAQQEELKTSNEELEQQARALESQQQALSIKNSELENTKTELQQKASELENSSQYKSDFLAKMSHELRTPLNGLLILSTLLIENKEKNLSDQQREFARSINSAGNDLLVLINDILDLAKIEARKLTLRPEDFTLASLFQSKQRTFEQQVAEKGLKFIAEIPEDLGKLHLYTDRHRLDQILRNFLSNAIKFTEKGTITLSAEHSEVAKTITFKVMDTGIGIPQNKLDSIFEAFEQADSSVSRKYGGTGLGLTISRELASLLGGSVSVKSEEGVGCQFRLQIPTNLKLDMNTEERTSSREARGERQPKFETTTGFLTTSSDRIKNLVKSALKGIKPDKKTILVVEDDEKFRASVVETVKAYDFQTIEVGDGEVALAVLNERSPDAILLDIKLPGISGLGILEMIKQIPHLRHVPVHMISALEYQHSALRMGALGYLTKPVTVEKIRSALGRIESMISKNLRRVLLIEDDERQNKAVAELISGKDIEVVSVKTGKAAVEQLKTKGFDCIILDLTLPDVSGFDLLSEISSLDISVPPIVIYTGKDLSDEEETYLRKFSESIVIKGARSPERLLDEVNLFLHRVESLLPSEKREMLSHLRSQEKSFEGKTVLLVDDDIRNVFALTSALESKGLKIRVARNGLEALEALDKHSDVNIVFMDIMMPKMDGFEAMRHIRKNPEARIRAVPIVALTAKAMRGDHEKCMEAGASDYLPKPVNLDNLMTVLRVWLAPKGFLS